MRHTSLSPQADIAFGSHALPVFCCLLAAAAVAFLSICLNGADEWVDAVRYMAAGKSIVLNGKFSPEALGYAEFISQGAAAYGAIAHHYPGPGFTVTIGWLGLLRGDFSLVNPLLLNFFVALGTGLVLYALGFALLKKRWLSVVFVLLVFLHREYIDNAGRPLTDMSLLFFMSAAALAQVRGHTAAAALIFGFSYLFREVGILFLPLLPLLAPGPLSFKGYCKHCFFYALALLPFFLLGRAANACFTYGDQYSDFYLNFSRFLAATLSLESIPYLLNHLYILLKSTAGLPLLGTAIFWRTAPDTARRLCLAGVVYCLMVCVLTAYSISMPERYFLPALPFLTLAALAAGHSYDRGKSIAATLLCIVLLVVGGRNYRMPGIALNLFGSGASIAGTFDMLHAPMRLAPLLPPGSALLSESQLGDYAAPDCVQVNLPRYEDFVAHDNKNVAAVMLYRPHDGWKDAAGEKLISDAFGNVFVKFEAAPLPDKHVYYIREDLLPPSGGAPAP